MSNLLEFARTELKAAGLLPAPDVARDTEYDGMIGPAVLTLLEVLASQGHSGGSMSAVLPLFTQLAQFQPLSPITGADDEWFTHDYEAGAPPMYQNKRNGAVFKMQPNDRAYYLDAIVWRTQNGHQYTGPAFLRAGLPTTILSRQYVRFPFVAKSFVVDVIETEVAKDDWEFVIKDPRQLEAVWAYYDEYRPDEDQPARAVPLEQLVESVAQAIDPVADELTQRVFNVRITSSSEHWITASDRQAAVKQILAIDQNPTTIVVDGVDVVGFDEDSQQAIFEGDTSSNGIIPFQHIDTLPHIDTDNVKYATPMDLLGFLNRKQPPTTLDEAVEYVLPLFRGMQPYMEPGQHEFAAYCHLQRSGGIAMQIRNMLHLWVHESALHQHFLTEHNLFEPDSMSDLIIRRIYLRLWPEYETYKHRKVLAEQWQQRSLDTPVTQEMFDAGEQAVEFCEQYEKENHLEKHKL